MNTFYIGQNVVYRGLRNHGHAVITEMDGPDHCILFFDDGEMTLFHDSWIRPESVMEAIKRTLWPPDRWRVRDTGNERVYMPGDVVLLGETKLRVLGLSKSKKEKGPGLVYECEVIWSGTKIDAAEFILRPYSHNKSALWRAYDFIFNQ